MTLLDQYQYYINNLPRLFSYTLTVKFRFANKIAFRVPTFRIDQENVHIFAGIKVLIVYTFTGAWRPWLIFRLYIEIS